MYEEIFLILQEKVIKESNEAIKKWNIKKYMETNQFIWGTHQFIDYKILIKIVTKSEKEIEHKITSKKLYDTIIKSLKKIPNNEINEVKYE